jgi:hypothetical protein
MSPGSKNEWPDLPGHDRGKDYILKLESPNFGGKERDILAAFLFAE